jgi:hypothetical protein
MLAPHTTTRQQASRLFAAQFRGRSSEDKPSCLLSHDFYDHPLGAPSIKFSVEDLLPGTEVKFSVGHGDDDFVMDDQRFQVGVSIVLSGLVMLVVLAEGGERFQPLIDVSDESAFVVVDVGPGRDMHRGYEDHTVFDSGLLQRALDLWRQVDISALCFCVEGEILGVEFHTPHLSRTQFHTSMIPILEECQAGMPVLVIKMNPARIIQIYEICEGE